MVFKRCHILVIAPIIRHNHEVDSINVKKDCSLVCDYLTLFPTCANSAVAPRLKP